MELPDDPRSREALADPVGFFHRLRAHDPVHWSKRARAWVVTSHEEVCAAFKDNVRLSSDRLTPMESRMPDAERAAMAQTFDLLRGWMVFRDSPDHERLRDPLRRVFTPHQVKRLASRIQAIVDGLLDEMAKRDRCELVSAFAFPLPAIVIAELLGVPPEDRDQFKTWASKLGAIVFGALERSDRHEVAREGAAEFADYFEHLIRRYEKRPADNLISRLIAARDSGEALTPDQMVGACTLLLFGGHETTTGLIANGMATLLENPAQLELLRRQPDLAPSAVEELLRVAGPAKVMVRHVREAHHRGGHRLDAGDRVYLAIAGANRDPDVFPDPDRIDITRRVNPHVGFGHGLHFCLGANLARREVQIALNSLLARFPNLRLTEPVQWTGTIIGTGVAGVSLQLH
jgi:cytochrome P450